MSACIFSAACAQAAVSGGEIKSVRAALDEFPRFEVRNAGGQPRTVRIESSLERVDGTVERQATNTYTLAAGETKTLPACTDAIALKGEIVLLRSVIAIGDEPAQTESAIVGTPRQVARGGDHLVGMNCHLQRYTAEEQWRLLRLMKAAGVTTVRIEPGFRAPDRRGGYSFSQGIDQSVLGAEAFGMVPLIELSFFPKEFYRSPKKLAMAYGWAKAIGEHYKGRVYDYEYGNETNCGWAGYGAAADMTAHNQAMALGSLAADPDNVPATFGIAEGLPDYLSEMFRAGIGSYVKAVCIHPYCGVAEAGVAKAEANRRIIAEYGGRQELWLTEIGFHVSEPGPLNPVIQQFTQVNGFTLGQQADQLARLFILGKAKGIERIYWYDFFGKKDRETFWLVDKDFEPRPAYLALKYIAPFLRDAVSLGGTPSDEAVQRQLFRRPDGSVFLAAWAQHDGVVADLRLPPLPPGKTYVASDILGKPVKIDPSRPTTLGERPILIEGLPSGTRPFEAREVLADAVDKRNWSAPMQRWTANPGDKIMVPCVVFNAGSEPVTAHAVLLHRYPDWRFKLPPSFEVGPGQTVTRQIEVTLPKNLVPGVEYRPSFAVETAGPCRTIPFEARIWVNGDFPYNRLLVENGETPAYPMRRIIDESRVGFGREEIEVKRASATVDGDLSEWTPAEFVTLDQVGQWKLRDAGRPMREDWFARAALRWDSSHLYFACIVLDDDLSLLDLTSRDWRDSDNVRLFLSTAPAAERTREITKKDFLLFMTPTRQFHDEAPAVMAASLGGYVRMGFESQVKIASRVWHGGYLIEASVPFSALEVSPRAGLTLGCNIMGDDADAGFRQHTGMTTFKSLDYWNSPTSLGTLKLLPATPAP